MNVIPFKRFKIKTTINFLKENGLFERYCDISSCIPSGEDIELMEHEAIKLGLLKWG
jgi:hypothetical protein